MHQCAEGVARLALAAAAQHHRVAASTTAPQVEQALVTGVCPCNK